MGRKGSRFGAKQTVRVSKLQVNITLHMNCTPLGLQFSHTLTLVLQLLQSRFWSHTLQPAQLNALLILGPSHKSGRKHTSDKVSPPQPAALLGTSDSNVRPAFERNRISLHWNALNNFFFQFNLFDSSTVGGKIMMPYFSIYFVQKKYSHWCLSCLFVSVKESSMITDKHNKLTLF